MSLQCIVMLSNLISHLKMGGCDIGNKGAELLVKHYPNKNTTGQLLEELNLRSNDLTSEGMEHVMKIVRTSKPYYCCWYTELIIVYNWYVCLLLLQVVPH